MTNKGCEFEIERYRIEQEPFYVESQGEVGLFATAAQNRMPVRVTWPSSDCTRWSSGSRADRESG